MLRISHRLCLWRPACSRYRPPHSDPEVRARSPPPSGSGLCPPASAQVARLLGVPAVLTEQYPQGLGPTVPELGAEGLRPQPKTCFSMVPAVRQELDAQPQLRSVLLCGIETQACILVRPRLTSGNAQSHLDPHPRKAILF